ncbi:hypothetical protein ACLKA7_013959 [Drosophila subpalustris]
MLRFSIVLSFSASETGSDKSSKDQYYQVKRIDFLYAVELPKDIKKCRFGNHPCIINSTNELIRRYSKGIAEVGLEPFDNIKIEDITLINSPGPIYIYYKLIDQFLKGFENATVTNITGFEQNPELSHMEINLKIPRLVLQGSYELQGRGLIVYTNASGLTHSDLQNVRVSCSIKGFIEYRNNKRYLKIYDLVPHIEMDRWILWADNLYKENTDLTVILNRVVNENWLELWNEIQPTTLPAYSRSILKIINKFVQTVSYDDMFLSN